MAPSKSASQSREQVLAALSDVIIVDSNSSINRNDNHNPMSENRQNANHPPPPPDKTDYHSIGNPTSYYNRNNSASTPNLEPQNIANNPSKGSSMGMGARLAGAFRKAAGQDKETKRKEKAARMKEEIDRSAAKTSRMDVIDRLDLSGIHGSSMFHHDSPYDAVSPHYNRHSKKAPVNAFDANVDPMTGKKRASTSNPKASSPLSQATPSSHTKSKPSYSRGFSSSNNTNNLPVLPSEGMQSPNESNASFVDQSRNPSSTFGGGHGEEDSTTSASVPPSEAGDNEDRGYYKTPSNQAEIWGATSEPWQDFASPTTKKSSKDKNKRSSKQNGGLMPGGSGFDPSMRSGTTSSASSIMDMEAILTGKTSSQRKEEEEEAKRRADLDGENMVGAGVSPFPERDWSAFRSGNGNSPNEIDGGAKRSKSLIKRIKSARQSPNVPPPDSVDDVELSSISNENDLNQRRYRNGNVNRSRNAGHRYSPSTPPTQIGGSDSPSINVSNSPNQNDGRIRIQTDGLSTNDRSYSPGGTTPTSYSNNKQQDSHYLRTGYGDDETRGRSNSSGSNGLGRSGSLFSRFGRKGKGEKK